MSYLIIANDTLLGSFKTPQPGYYLRISKEGRESSLVSYQLLLILPLKKDIPVVFSAGKSGLVKPGVLFPEFPLVFRWQDDHWLGVFTSLRSTLPVTRQNSEIPAVLHGSGLSVEQKSRGSGLTVLYSVNPFIGAFTPQHAAQQTLPHSNGRIQLTTSSV